ncbi:MAG: DnaB-like helicase C-terminal domain-containing protein, partial [Candidatus Brocadiia bacterium]
DDSVALSPAQLRSRARKLKATYDIHAIFIDYMQLMQGDRERRWENRQQEVADISRGLKLLAKELQIPIIAGSQISREAESGKEMRPKLSQMRESGAIEQDADVVLMLYRDDYYNTNSKEPNIAEVIIGKQRHGPTGTVKLLFQREFLRFENTTSQ